MKNGKVRARWNFAPPIGILMMTVVMAVRAQLAPQIYSANDFLSISTAGQPLTNAITIQPWPPTTATTISGLNFIVGTPQTLTPVNGTNIFYLYPNYYRITWAGLPYAATFAVLPGAANLTNVASEVQSGASVFWGTNNFQYQAVVDAADTTPGTLGSKIAAGTGGYMSTNNVGGDEVLVFNFPTNISTLLSQVGFTNGAMLFTMNNNGLMIANTNGGIFAIGTNDDINQTNRYGGSFGFHTNNFYVNLPAFGSQPSTSLLLSNGVFTVSANEAAQNLTIATNFTIGSASMAAGTGAIAFTNGTQANINIILAQVSATLWTNTVFGFSVVSNGLWNYLNASGQTMWTLGGSPPPVVPIGNPWTIGSAGSGAAPGSSPVTVLGGIVQINGQVGITNFTASGNFSGTFAGTASGNFTGTFNGGASTATNDLSGRLLTTMLDTNLFSQLSQGCVLVSPATNLPAQLLTNPFYFSPALGSNYVQLAVNSLPTYSDRLHVGGGKIIVAGQNFYPNPLIFTNNQFQSSVMNYDIEAPMFAGGALICATNPAIRVEFINRGGNFEMKDLIVASLNNGPTNLVEFGKGSIGTGANVGTLDVEGDWFGYWNYLTNNQDTYGLAGLTPPTTGGQIGQRNLIISVDNPNADMTRMVNDRFLGIQSLYFSPDHSHAEDLFFSFCGGSYAANGTNATAWTNGIYSLGAAFILGNTGINQNQWYINNLHFYGDYDGYYSQTAVTHIVHNSYFEQTTACELGTLPILDGVWNSGGSPQWNAEYGYSAPEAFAMNGGTNTQLQIAPNMGNQDVGYFSIPVGATLEGGDQNSFQTVGDNRGAWYGENGNQVFSNLDLFWQIAPSPGTVSFSTVQPQDTIDGHQPIAFSNPNAINLNADGTINLQNQVSGATLTVSTNDVAANVPFTGNFIGPATVATNVVAGTILTNYNLFKEYTYGVPDFYGSTIVQMNWGNGTQFPYYMLNAPGGIYRIIIKNSYDLENAAALDNSLTNLYFTIRFFITNAGPCNITNIGSLYITTNSIGGTVGVWTTGNLNLAPTIAYGTNICSLTTNFALPYSIATNQALNWQFDGGNACATNIFIEDIHVQNH